MNKKWEFYEKDEESIKKIQDEFQISRILATIIYNKNLKTTKVQKNEHGYGLKGIETLVSKYNGDLSIVCENNEFTLSCILVNKNVEV